MYLAIDSVLFNMKKIDFFKYLNDILFKCGSFYIQELDIYVNQKFCMNGESLL